MARPKLYWNVHPRYTPGSPAALFESGRRIVSDLVESERRGYQADLEGFSGPEQQARAQRLGLRGIVVLMQERRNRWDCYDEVTEEHYERPFDNRMRKDGFVRWRDLEPHIQELVETVEPVIVREAREDDRPFWFRNVSLVEFWNPQGGYDTPTTPDNFLWEPRAST